MSLAHDALTFTLDLLTLEAHEHIGATDAGQRDAAAQRTETAYQAFTNDEFLRDHAATTATAGVMAAVSMLWWHAMDRRGGLVEIGHQIDPPSADIPAWDLVFEAGHYGRHYSDGLLPLAMWIRVEHVVRSLYHHDLLRVTAHATASLPPLPGASQGQAVHDLLCELDSWRDELHEVIDTACRLGVPRGYDNRAFRAGDP